jgi:signal transduction histidine kinase
LIAAFPDLEAFRATVPIRISLQSVQLVQSIPENLVIILDSQRILRVLVNLFVNALDVITGRGTIRIAAIPERRSVLMKVRDTGPGIAPELRDRLFQPFATARKVGGLGLGLYFSRQAIFDHGGQMWLSRAAMEPVSLFACLGF